MATLTQTTGLALNALSVIVFATVALFLARRPVSEGARGAQRGFVLWWAGLALLGIYGLVVNDVYGIAPAEYGLASLLTTLYALFALIFVALGGLMYYLLYLYTGRRDALWWPLAYYTLLMAVVVWLVHGFGGACVVPHDTNCVNPAWSPGDAAVLGSYDPRPDWAGPLFGIALVLPALAAAVMYFRLFFRVDDATSKYRVLLTSLGIILWFTFSLANSVASAATESQGSDLTAVVGKLMGLLAAGLVLLAYFPPRWVRARFGVSTLAEQGSPAE